MFLLEWSPKLRLCNAVGKAKKTDLTAICNPLTSDSEILHTVASSTIKLCLDSDEFLLCKLKNIVITFKKTKKLSYLLGHQF